MKHQVILSSALFVLLFSCGESPKPTVSATDSVKPDSTKPALAYQIDTTSYLEWEGYEGLSLGKAEHKGTLRVAAGTLQVDSNMVSGGEFAVNLGSIIITDLAEGSGKNAKLKGHLLSADFFDAEKYPQAKFTITSVKATVKDSVLVSGNLALKGIEKNISFPAATTVSDSVVTAVSPTFYINRKDWGINYKSENSLGDEMIRPEIGIRIKISGRK